MENSLNFLNDLRLFPISRSSGSKSNSKIIKNSSEQTFPIHIQTAPKAHKKDAAARLENSRNAILNVTQIEAKDGAATKNGKKWKTFQIIRTQKRWKKLSASRLFALRNGFLDSPVGRREK